MSLGSSTTSPAAALRVLERAGIAAEHGARALRAFDEQVARSAARPAGWHGGNDIVTLEGLAGSYVWAEKALQPARIEFQFEAGHVGSQGTYQLQRAWHPKEQGQFFCVPNNPAVGWAFISLMPDQDSPRTFTIDGMLTDDHWKILLLLLNRLGSQGPVAPAFTAIRES